MPTVAFGACSIGLLLLRLLAGGIPIPVDINSIVIRSRGGCTSLSAVHSACVIESSNVCFYQAFHVCESVIAYWHFTRVFD